MQGVLNDVEGKDCVCRVPGSSLSGEDEVVEEGNTALAAVQVELLFVQGIYFVSHAYVFTMTARLMSDSYYARVRPMNG